VNTEKDLKSSNKIEYLDVFEELFNLCLIKFAVISKENSSKEVVAGVKGVKPGIEYGLFLAGGKLEGLKDCLL
jgi:hypothetical protein